MRRQIDTAYNNQGLAYLLTSYADTAGTQIVNQVENVYNGLGQLTQQYQAVTGAVDTSTTPSVQYTYSDPSIGSRLMSMVYPNGRTIDYNYSGSNLNGALDNAIGRLDSISDASSGQILEQYSYLGLSTIVARNHPQTGINLTLVGASGSIGSGGDQYVGLDQFGRIADQNWVNTSTGQSTDNFTYSYDANSNVTGKNNLLNTAYSETYTYDQLNRLTAVTRGGASYQSWGLDAQGNWNSFTSNGSTQTRTANGQNQITSISGTAGTPAYDANGDMITDQSGNTLVYDAWNRLVEVKNASGQAIAQYTYDARGYRVSEFYPLGGNGVAPDTINYIYYDSNWQAIEVRTNGTAASNVTSQTVWSAAYINAAVLQDSYVAGVLVADSRLYFQQDANWNTTAVVGYDATTGTWNVVQRYVYSPYGNITVLNADWSTPPVGTSPMVNNLYQGMALDSVTGLYYERYRNYSPSLGTWISQDPLSYVNGANTYQFVVGNPVGATDPSGFTTSGSQLTIQQYQAQQQVMFDQWHAEQQAMGRPTGGPSIAGTVGSWFGALGHMLTRAGQGFWDLSTGNQQFMNALSPHDQPLNQILINRLKQAEHQPHGARPGCAGAPQDKARLLAALAAEEAANAANAAAIAMNASNLHTAIGSTVNSLVALEAGIFTGGGAGIVFENLGGEAASTIYGRLAGAGFVFGNGMIGSLVGGQLASLGTGVPMAYGAPEVISGAGDILNGAGGGE